MGDESDAAPPSEPEDLLEHLQRLCGDPVDDDDGIRPVGYTFFRTNGL